MIYIANKQNEMEDEVKVFGWISSFARTNNALNSTKELALIRRGGWK